MLKKRIFFRTITWIIVIGVLAAVSVALILLKSKNNHIPKGFAAGNGRLEATEVDIATKYPGRISRVLVREGDSVTVNQILAVMETTSLEAQLRQAEAEVRRAREARQSAIFRVEATRLQSELATKELDRSTRLLAKGSVTQQRFDHDLTARQAYEAEYTATKATVTQAEAAIDAAVAQAERLKVEINDSILRSPRKGRVLNRLAEPGEILPSGGKVLTIMDPEDMYMTVFLSEKFSGNIAVGAEARIVPDAFPDRPFRGNVAFISEKSQFTPKEVETTEERQNLVFRVKVRIQEMNDPRLKPGIPGMSYIRIDPSAPWPENLR